MINWNSTLDSFPLTQENCLTKQVDYAGQEPDYVICWYSVTREEWFVVTANLIAENYDGGAFIGLDRDYKPTHWIYLVDLDND